MLGSTAGAARLPRTLLLSQWCRLVAVPGQQRCLHAGRATVLRNLQKVEPKSGGQNQVQTTFSESVKKNAQTASYAGVILFGLGVTGAIVYTLFTEVFSKYSPTALYQRAADVCLAHEKVQDLLGEPLKAFGEETRRGRRRHVSHLDFIDEEGRRGMKIRFYLQGCRKRGTAILDVREDSKGHFQTHTLIVTADDLLRTNVVVEDNRISDIPAPLSLS